MRDPSTTPEIREQIRVRGVVQGVGFRPFVYRVARGLELAGHVLNDGQGVLIELQGTPERIERFCHTLTHDAPPLAQLHEVERETIPVAEPEAFHIRKSGARGRGGALIPVDTATCDACRAELLDPDDRRYRYAFTNCTDCGPRYTIIRDLPYDRPLTTMAGFPMCPACQAEYDDPMQRRFHAQPNACPVCGPRLSLLLPSGERVPEDDPLTAAVDALRAGKLLAIKGLGGYHLACDATDEEAVARLRGAKGRDRKPFAVMAADVEAARGFAEVGEPEEEALGGLDRPIVLLTKLEPSPLAPSVAPGLGSVGVMLPYTPLHHLLLAEVGRPALVMTSGNRSAEPIVTDEAAARETLGPMVDLLLVHDRPIEARADDSVLRVMGGRARPFRRSRGWAPNRVALPVSGPAVLAVGGALKATICLAEGGRAFLSPHIGDLDHPATRDFLAHSAGHLGGLLGIEPELIVHDLHPDYPSTLWAQQQGLPTFALQHHHAHGLACLAEHGVREPALVLALDGTGYGTDGAIWGGELLLVDGLEMTRLGHLLPIPLPGGDRAAREPWRLALAVWTQQPGDGADPPDFEGVAPARLEGTRRLLAGRGRALMPHSSAMGRVFDAASSLLGVCHASGFEGEAPMRLEDAAWRALRADTPALPPLPWQLEGGDDGRPWVLDLLPGLRQLPELRDRPTAAALTFHRSVAAALTELTLLARDRTGLCTVALTGGVLQNRMLHETLVARLAALGLRVLTHREVPANDGGLSLGQAYAGSLR